jgi:hypothetical protein
MASDFIELGIEGIDKLVDKHFHKVPDKYVNPHTYHVHRRRHQHGQKTRDDEEESSSGDSGVGYDPRPEQSHQHQRMSRPRDANGYEYGYLPLSSHRLGPDTWDSRARQRPEGLVRRSSSQPVGLRDSDREKGRGERIRDRRRRSLSGNRGRNSAKTESGKGQKKTGTVALTLLGIAAGSLAASAVIDMMDRKRDRGEKVRVDEGGRSSGGHRDGRAEGMRTKGGGRK